MAYKDIVVHVAPDERSPERLDAAVELAERHDGKVTGVYVLSRLTVPGFASFDLSTEVYKRLDAEQRTLAEEAERLFTERTAKSTAASEWRLTTGDPRRCGHDERTLRRHHRGRPDQPRRQEQRHRGWRTASCSAAGGPVLIWPYAGSFSVDAATIMLAWNSTREAKRALSDALPLMQQADKVVVLGIDTGDGKHIPGAEVAAYLARHGRHRGGPPHGELVRPRRERRPALRDQRSGGAPPGHGRLRPSPHAGGSSGRRDPRHPAPDDRAGPDVALEVTRARPSLTDARQAATAARRESGAPAQAPAAGRLP